jgi:hypothetical protein
MYCKICGYEAHEGCCEGCIGHTTDGYCVTEELLEVQTARRLSHSATGL